MSDDFTRAVRAPLAQLFRVLAEDPDQGLFLLDDRSLGFGFICHPLSGVNSGLVDRLNVLLNQEWPVNTLIQCLLFASPDLRPEEAKGRKGATRASLPERLDERSRRFRSQATDNPIEELNGTLLRRSELILTFKLPLKALEPGDAEIKEALKLSNATFQTLSTIGLRPVRLDGSRWLRLMATLLNWDAEALWRDEPPRPPVRDMPLRDQVMDFTTSLSVTKDDIHLGSRDVRLLSVKRYPDAAPMGGALRYLGDLLSGSRGIRQNVLLGMTLHYPDIESHKSRIAASRQWITTQATGPMARFMPRLGARKQQFDLLFEAFEDGDRPIRAALSLALMVRPDEATRAVANARVYFRELGFQLLEDRFIALPLFLNLLPLGAERDFVEHSLRFRTLATRQALPLMPLFADWAGSGGSMLSLISRSGEAMRFSLFDSPTNYNASIAAQSGSGKSFLTNEIIVRALAEGARVWVIDIGRSYQNLAESLGGDFMAFGTASQTTLNPFHLLRDWNEDADLIASIFAAMVAPTSTLSDYQTATLKRTLKDLHEVLQQAVTIDLVAETLLQESDSRIRDLGAQLFPFTSQGEYGRHFSEGEPMAFDAAFTVLELEELKGRRHLQKVVLLLLILQIQKAMFEGPRDQKKLVIIDESWDLLTEGDAAAFIETGYRRFRKYGGAAITLTQSVNDLYRSAAGRAIVENSGHLLLLGQKAEALDLLKREDRLSLGEAGYALLKSVHTVPGRYSEVFIHGETGSGIGRLVVDPYKRLLFSTHPEDVAAIRSLRQQGHDLESAIETLISARQRAA